MAANTNFDSVVSARTVTATQVLATGELITQFIELGGLKRDLEAIKANGLLAESLNHAQGSMMSDGQTATAEALAAFGELQREYVLFLAVLQIIEEELRAAGNAAAPKVAHIIANHAAVTVSEGEAGPDGKKTRKAAKSAAQENVRAEIERDAADALAIAPLASALTERRWSATRVKKLREDAIALKNKLGERQSKKGAAKTATQNERQAVLAQRRAWAAAYRLLAALGRRDARVALLLRDSSA